MYVRSSSPEIESCVGAWLRDVTEKCFPEFRVNVKITNKEKDISNQHSVLIVYSTIVASLMDCVKNVFKRLKGILSFSF